MKRPMISVKTVLKTTMEAKSLSQPLLVGIIKAGMDIKKAPKMKPAFTMAAVEGLYLNSRFRTMLLEVKVSFTSAFSMRPKSKRSAPVATKRKSAIKKAPKTVIFTMFLSIAQRMKPIWFVATQKN